VSSPSFSPFYPLNSGCVSVVPLLTCSSSPCFELKLAARVPAGPPASSATGDHLICIVCRTDMRVFRAPALNSTPPWTPSSSLLPAANSGRFCVLLNRGRHQRFPFSFVRSPSCISSSKACTLLSYHHPDNIAQWFVPFP
jgi:hypothetical protein